MVSSFVHLHSLQRVLHQKHFREMLYTYLTKLVNPVLLLAYYIRNESETRFNVTSSIMAEV